MTEYRINCALMTGRAEAHAHIKQALSLPEYYGGNLDALYDCLTDKEQCHITLENINTLSALGCYGKLILQVFREAAENNKNIHITEI